ncbi:HAMP domain-containing sensor histidine kinase [Botryobacter ruber]|uniref:HAMP domain-containing sensor histidine kinase n=1 Tax=Botryobacter ruber TaxID=2171629 RepID=UPI000E0AC36C|nr:HAMP domain-containing sensor histidine kinase [Botryobacter ruber]
MKIRTRLTLQFAVIFAIILILFSLVIYFFNSLYRKDDFFKRIEKRAHIISHYVLDDDEIGEQEAHETMISYYHALPFEVVRVYRSTGELVFADGDGDLHVSQNLLEKVRQRKKVAFEQGDRQVVGMTFTDNEGDFVVFSSSVDAYSLRKLQYLRLILIGGFLGSMVVVVVAGWAFAKEALRPITNVVNEVQKINATDLDKRLSNAEGNDELSFLAQTFNQLLDRLEHAFEMQRTFVSNASHELRTPLTAMTGELEVALMKDREPQEYRRVLKSTLEEARLLTELSNGLLQIAQASVDPSKIQKTYLRFDELLWQAKDQALKRQPEARFDISFANFPDDEDRLVVKGNEALLLVAIVNVLENAVKFSSAGQHVSVLLAVDERNVVLQVQDSGLGIAEEDLKHVFVPFFRAGNVRSITGHGIGLPLAERILKLHRGTINLHSKLNRGTEVTIALPQAYGFIPTRL